MIDPARIGAIRALAAADRGDEATRELTMCRGTSDLTPERAREIAALALEIGAVELALAELQTASARAPDDLAIASDLEALRAELALGPGGAAEARETTAATSPEALPLHDEVEADPLAMDPFLEPSDADLVRFVHAFGGREGVHARQWADAQRSGYSPVHQPLTPELVRGHLAGDVTLGTYLVRLDDTVVGFVLDLDLTKAALTAAAGHGERVAALRRLVHDTGLDLRDALDALELPCLLIDSGYKGRHLWGLLEGPMPAALVHHAAHVLARHLAPSARELDLEAFPKQASVELERLGNLVKLPLGIHRRSGRRAMLLDEAGDAIRDPWPVLRRPRRIAQTSLIRALQLLEPHAAPRRAGEIATSDEASGRARGWLDDDALAAHAELGEIRRGCAVIDTLVVRAQGEHRLCHDEQVVVAHTLGHLADGPRVVNAIFGRCPEIPRHKWLSRPFRGHPISCAKIRQRIPQVTSRLPCHCLFAESHAAYPTPILHLATSTSRTPSTEGA